MSSTSWWAHLAPGLETDVENPHLVRCEDDCASDWPSALGGAGGEPWTSGVQEYAVRILSARLQNLYIGVASPDHNLTMVCGETPTSWSFYPHDGDITSSSKCFRFRDHSISTPVQTGDIVRVRVDFESDEISFAVNEEAPSMAFKGISGPVVPCVTLGLAALALEFIPNHVGAQGYHSSALRTHNKPEAALPGN